MIARFTAMLAMFVAAVVVAAPAVASAEEDVPTPDVEVVADVSVDAVEAGFTPVAHVRLLQVPRPLSCKVDGTTVRCQIETKVSDELTVVDRVIPKEPEAGGGTGPLAFLVVPDPRGAAERWGRGGDLVLEVPRTGLIPGDFLYEIDTGVYDTEPVK